MHGGKYLTCDFFWVKVMNYETNIALLSLIKRAEMSSPKVLVDTFVDTGMLKAMLTSVDHQVIYGRRGTGKTHALLYLGETKKQAGDMAIYVDMRTIGSSVGVFSDDSLSVAERATRLLRDVLANIHNQLYEAAISNADRLNLGEIGNQLDALYDAATATEVVGTITSESQVNQSEKQEQSSAFSAAVSEKSATLNANAGVKSESTAAEQKKISSSGKLIHRVRFGAIGQTLGTIAKSISPHRLWILLDEWSAVPLELQPYLADLVRRCLFPTPGISVKIGAIEQRSHFKLSADRGDYVGIEVGADATADLNLDDFMVFENDAEKAVAFFKGLIYRHYKASRDEINAETEADSGENTTSKPEKKKTFATEDEFISETFTQKNVFDEIVRAAEGVPRDAINVIAMAAQKASSSPISVNHARIAAKTWYQRDKESSVTANPLSIALLRWIVDEVIAHRKARAFLVESGIRDEVIDSLFDSRVLHVLKRSISAPDKPGLKYDAYKIDYGCYVDLLSTAKAPQGLLPLGDESDDGKGYGDGEGGNNDRGYAEVPPDDYRAIRRAILHLDSFYSGYAPR